jgi:hypothetical protein
VTVVPPLGATNDTTRPGVRIGTAIVSYIEPHPGLALEFNRWYERDHFPATVTAGPGVFAGARWVATRACKALRPPRGRLFGDPARGSYLATAWVLPGLQAGWDAWVADAMKELVAQDRMFAGRDHVHTAIYACRSTARAEGGPGAEMALDHGFDGVFAIAVGRDADCDEWVDTLLRHQAARTVVALRQERLVISTLGEAAVSDPTGHRLLLGFVEGDVLELWRTHLAPLVDDPAVGFASPFLRTIPGTDTYTDDL